MKSAPNQTPYYAFAVVCFIALKFLYRYTNTDDLFFLLAPTNFLVKLMTGFRSVYIPNTGFFFESMQILIDRSCSGFNFWLICFLMLVFLTVKHMKQTYQKILACIFSLISAFFFTVFVNSARIFASIIIKGQNFSILQSKPELVHEAIGVVTYLTFLILIYLVIERIFIYRQDYAKST